MIDSRKIVDDVRNNENDRCRDANFGLDEEQGRDKRVYERQARLVGRADRVEAAIVPGKAMLDQKSGVIEPGSEQARSPDATNDDAPTLHRSSLRQLIATGKPQVSAFHPLR